MKCHYQDCSEKSVISVNVHIDIALRINRREEYGGRIDTHFCISHMRDFAIYVADRLEAAEKVNDQEERQHET